MEFIPTNAIAHTVEEVLAATPVVDMHTHLFAPQFGPLGLSGIDNLLTYRADLIWKTLFVESPPLCEGTRGVIAVLQALSLDTSAPELKQSREYFRDNAADSDVRFAPALRLDRILNDGAMTSAAELARQFELLSSEGRAISKADVETAVTRLFRTNFENWIALS